MPYVTTVSMGRFPSELSRSGDLFDIRLATFIAASPNGSKALTTASAQLEQWSADLSRRLSVSPARGAPDFYRRLAAAVDGFSTLTERALGLFGGSARQLGYAARLFTLAAERVPLGEEILPVNVAELRRSAEEMKSAARSLAYAARKAGGAR